MAIEDLGGPGSQNGAYDRQPHTIEEQQGVAELLRTYERGIRVRYFEMAFHVWIADVDWLLGLKLRQSW